MSKFIAADFDKEGKGYVLKCQSLAGMIYFMDEVAFEDCPEELKGRSILIEKRVNK